MATKTITDKNDVISDVIISDGNDSGDPGGSPSYTMENNLAVFCPCSEMLWEPKLNSDGLVLSGGGNVNGQRI